MSETEHLLQSEAWAFFLFFLHTSLFESRRCLIWASTDLFLICFFLWTVTEALKTPAFYKCCVMASVWEQTAHVYFWQSGSVDRWCGVRRWQGCHRCHRCQSQVYYLYSRLLCIIWAEIEVERNFVLSHRSRIVGESCIMRIWQDIPLGPDCLGEAGSKERRGQCHFGRVWQWNSMTMLAVQIYGVSKAV